MAILLTLFAGLLALFGKVRQQAHSLILRFDGSLEHCDICVKTW